MCSKRNSNSDNQQNKWLLSRVAAENFLLKGKRLINIRKKATICAVEGNNKCT